MIPQELKKKIEQYMGIQPSDKQLDDLFDRCSSLNLSAEQKKEVAEYLDIIIDGPTKEQVEALEKRRRQEEVERIAAEEKRKKEEAERRAAEEKRRKQEEEERRAEIERRAEEVRKYEARKAAREEEERKQAIINYVSISAGLIAFLFLCSWCSNPIH